MGCAVKIIHLTMSVPSGYVLKISNKHRRSTLERPFQFTFPLRNIDTTLKGYYIQCLQVVFTNNFDNIRNDINDRFSYTFNGVKRDYKIAQGEYSIDTLLASINAVLAIDNAGLKVSYDSVQKKVIWTLPANSTFTLHGTFGYSEEYLLQDPFDRFLEVIGSVPDREITRSNTTGQPKDFMATNPVDLYGVRVVSVTLNSPLGVQSSSNRNMQTLVSVPVDVNRGMSQIYEPQQPLLFRVQASHLNELQIICRDEWEREIDAPSNTHFEMTLLLVPFEF